MDCLTFGDGWVGITISLLMFGFITYLVFGIQCEPWQLFCIAILAMVIARNLAHGFLTLPNNKRRNLRRVLKRKVERIYKGDLKEWLSII